MKRILFFIFVFNPLYGVEGVTWVMGSNGYPVPSGTTLAPSL